MNKKHVVTIVSICVIFCATFYYWGYLCGRRESDFELYEHLLIELDSDILVHDGIKSQKAAELKRLVTNTIETNFSKFVRMHNQHVFATSKLLRCAITRRFRRLMRDKEVLFDQASTEDYPMAEIADYLVKECPGEPSHINWMTMEKTKSAGADLNNPEQKLK